MTELALAVVKIAKGHAWTIHQHEFPEFVNADQFAEHLVRVVENPSAVKKLRFGRKAYWDHATQTVVIQDPRTPDGGTAFRPTRGVQYFANLR